jgi:hypothetical protein
MMNPPEQLEAPVGRPSAQRYHRISVFGEGRQVGSCAVPAVWAWPKAPEPEPKSGVVTLRLYLTVHDKSPGIVRHHPGYDVAYTESIAEIETAMKPAFDLACNVTGARSGRYQGYWCFEKDGEPFFYEERDGKRSLPWGRSATGAAFYGWSYLLRRQEPMNALLSKTRLRVWLGRVETTAVLAMVTEPPARLDLAPFDSQVLKIKAGAVCGDPDIKSVIVASKLNADTVAEVARDAGRRDMTIAYLR